MWGTETEWVLDGLSWRRGQQDPLFSTLHRILLKLQTPQSPYVVPTERLELRVPFLAKPVKSGITTEVFVLRLDSLCKSSP